MDKPSSYCDAVTRMDADNVHVKYHNKEYGFPVKNDNRLFERLVLEINQAGLSWTTILNKKENFYNAFKGFDISTVAGYGEKDFQRLMLTEGIIRNRLKINAAIENARRIHLLQQKFGSFKKWIDSFHPKTREEWVKIFKTNFLFTGGEIVNEFLMSTGYLPGAHVVTCPAYKAVLLKKPPWNSL